MTERLDAAALREALSYEPNTGHFYWRKGSRGRRAGSRAGGRNSKGYIQIRIGGKLYKAHRLAWLYQSGEWPRADIDHINRRKDDNRIANLRDVSRSVNVRNRPTLKNSSSGYTGVSLERRSGKWVATLRLGTFNTPEEARNAYCVAMETLGMETFND